MGRLGVKPTSFLNLTFLLIALQVIEVFTLTIMFFRDMSSLVSRGGSRSWQTSDTGATKLRELVRPVTRALQA
jgi:hypothetical protein